MKTLAEAALAVLAHRGERTPMADPAGHFLWRFETQTPQGTRFEIRLHGPDLPVTIPAHTVFPADIPKDPRWRGTHRLVVAPPLIAFDLCWRPEEPLRIMTFSRGDWEDQLTELASHLNPRATHPHRRASTAESLDR